MICASGASRARTIFTSPAYESCDPKSVVSVITGRSGFRMGGRYVDRRNGSTALAIAADSGAGRPKTTERDPGYNEMSMNQVKETSPLEKMNRQQIIERGITDARVVDAMRSTPREIF